MAFPRYFPTWTEAQLRVEYDRALKENATAKTSISFGAGDVSGAFQREHSIDEHLRRVYCDLNVLNPALYPLSNLRPRSTTAVFAALPNVVQMITNKPM